jgi:predicted enzyme related to lactoylglutathione lyase
MGNTVFGVAVDSTDAATLASFWAQVLGRQVADGATAEHAVVPADADAAHGPRLAFHRVPEPKTSKNRLQDLIAADFDAETARLLALGASRLNDFTQGGARWSTFADIEGNEFDLIGG